MPGDPARILLIKPSSLGDVVHALPVLAGLRRRFPAAHIAWLIGSSFAPLLDGHPLLDEVIPFDRRRYGRMGYDPRASLAFWRFVWELRGRRFDWVIDLQGLIRSGLISWFSGARRRVGFSHARECGWLFYSNRVRTHDPDRPDRHAVEHNLALARAIDLPVDPPEFPLAIRPAELASAQGLLAAAAGREVPRFTAVLPGARWESKLWPAAHFSRVIDALHEPDFPCVLLGGPDERERNASIAGACARPPLDLTGRTSLRQLAALLSLAARVVCGDSGPMHIAAALRRPIVAVFGPTSPDRTGPYEYEPPIGNTGAAAPAVRLAQVVRHAVPCAPCYRKTCPLGHHACLRELRPEEVVVRVRELPRAAPPTRVAATATESV
jgi:lipopolysaccharide heptosyltransferase I